MISNSRAKTHPIPSSRQLFQSPHRPLDFVLPASPPFQTVPLRIYHLPQESHRVIQRAEPLVVVMIRRDVGATPEAQRVTRDGSDVAGVHTADSVDKYPHGQLVERLGLRESILPVQQSSQVD